MKATMFDNKTVKVNYRVFSMLHGFYNNFVLKDKEGLDREYVTDLFINSKRDMEVLYQTVISLGLDNSYISVCYVHYVKSLRMAYIKTMNYGGVL